MLHNTYELIRIWLIRAIVMPVPPCRAETIVDKSASVQAVVQVCMSGRRGRVSSAGARSHVELFA